MKIRRVGTKLFHAGQTDGQTDMILRCDIAVV